MKSFLKILFGFALGAALLYIGFYYFMTEEQKQLLLRIPLTTHLISILLVIPTYLLSGIELNLLYRQMNHIKLSVYDTCTLPFAINLWGFIIPIQGSFLYTITYILSKYKPSLAGSTKVYLLSFSITMSSTGLIGLIYYFTPQLHLPIVFLMVSGMLLVNPVLLYSSEKILYKFRNGTTGLTNSFLSKILILRSSDKIDKRIIIYLVFLKILNIGLTSIWSYWISNYLNLNFTLVQIILLSLLMNITTLIKITPGNLGVSQIASGGIAVLVGSNAHEGFLLSSMQYITIILIAITFGTIFSLLNSRYLTWNSVWKVFTHQK